MDQEWQRLQGLYAGLGDGELLKLAASKDGLTAVAQQAVDAEMAARELVLPSDEDDEIESMPELPASESDPNMVELMTFEVPSEAETAWRNLTENGVSSRLERAMRRLVEGGPKVATNWLTVFVEKTQKEAAVVVLRKHMGLFPLAEIEDLKNASEEEFEDDEEALFTVGEFDVEADADVARKALTEAGIWFRAEKVSQESVEGQPAFEGTVIETRLEDLERAVQVVGEAFSEEA